MKGVNICVDKYYVHNLHSKSVPLYAMIILRSDQLVLKTFVVVLCISCTLEIFYHFNAIDVR
jgi:hypothetical protein